ncbi:response regulator transcription factor [Amycolatopsis suaedae]|uniref:Response regulator transcription factor n=1 Tax=Amycolatopsis suaedae TaxID=2510978 RepID=A0A4Q7J232_9PSEU|nr:response regulator transcription factor [Amycolatopsis suaedae]RZQ60642.1 response regulator transcription factor [Amycolatopsis suaedae]
MISVVLCDDHTLFSDALAAVLARHGFTVRGSTTRLDGVVSLVRSRQPEVCLLDRRFAEGDALHLIDLIRVASPGTRVLVLTADRDAAGQQEALRAGAAGFVQKTCGVAELTAAIRTVASGQTAVSAVPVQARREPGRRGDAAAARRLAGHLTARERECLALLVEGLSTSEMVDRLGVATTTVRTHVQALISKLGVHSRLEAVSLAVRHSLLDELETRALVG